MVLAIGAMNLPGIIVDRKIHIHPVDEGDVIMDNKREGLLSCAAAVLVLLACIFDPMFSACLAFVILLGFGLYHVTQGMEN